MDQPLPMHGGPMNGPPGGPLGGPPGGPPPPPPPPNPDGSFGGGGGAGDFGPPSSNSGEPLLPPKSSPDDQDFQGSGAAAGGSQLIILPREERPTLKGRLFLSLFRRWRQRQQQWKQQFRLFEQFFIGDAEFLLRPTAEPTAAAAAAATAATATRGKRSLVKAPPSFLLLPQQNGLQFECHSCHHHLHLLHRHPRRRGRRIHVLHSHFDLQKLPRAKSVYYITNFITLIGVCSVILRCKQSFNMFLYPQTLFWRAVRLRRCFQMLTELPTYPEAG